MSTTARRDRWILALWGLIGATARHEAPTPVVDRVARAVDDVRSRSRSGSPLDVAVLLVAGRLLKAQRERLERRYVRRAVRRPVWRRAMELKDLNGTFDYDGVINRLLDRIRAGAPASSADFRAAPRLRPTRTASGDWIQ